MLEHGRPGIVRGVGVGHQSEGGHRSAGVRDGGAWPGDEGDLALPGGLHQTQRSEPGRRLAGRQHDGALRVAADAVVAGLQPAEADQGQPAVRPLQALEAGLLPGGDRRFPGRILRLAGRGRSLRVGAGEGAGGKEQGESRSRARHGRRISRRKPTSTGAEARTGRAACVRGRPRRSRARGRAPRTPDR